MTQPISARSPALAVDRTASPSAAAQPATSPPFTRKAELAARPKEVPQMTGHRKLSDARLRELGSRIMKLYEEKILATGGRRLAVNPENGEGKWSLRGLDAKRLVLHTENGLIQFGPDGMPRRHAEIPIDSWPALEKALIDAVKTLEDVNPRPRPQSP